MDIQSLDNLKKDSNNLYNLHHQVLINEYNYGVYVFTCTERHNMRIDLISFDIYGNKNNIDVLCAVNGIFNPLTVQNGDNIFFVEERDVNNIRSNEDVLQALVDSITNANNGKETKQDNNRLQETSNRGQIEKEKKLSIPPNIIQSSTGNVDYSEGTIILKPNF
jgi:hypothetical protein